MKKIETHILEKSWTYPEYRDQVNELFAQGKSTGEDHSEAVLNYTKLNIARMRRLDKTTRLTETAIKFMGGIDRKVIWLVITEAWCGDAAQIIPVLQKMSEQNENVNLRLILRDENLEVMDEFLTNGARSIPVLLILDAETLEVLNSWGPRPAILQEMVMSAKSEAESQPERSDEIWNEVKKDTQLWYAKDKTKTIQEEILSVL